MHAVVHDPSPTALAALSSLPPGQLIVTTAAHSHAELASIQGDLSQSAMSWYQQGLDIRRIEIASDGVL